MKYNITSNDKDLLLQSEINYKYRLFVLDKEKKVIDEVQGISSIGTYSITSDSSIRRTTSFTLYLDATYFDNDIEKKISDWIGCDFELQIGIYSLRTNDYAWYKCGTYAITQTNTNYDARTSTLTTDLSDWYAKLNGDRNGQIGGAPTISIPNTDVDGKPITIRQTVIGVIQNAGINDYIIQDVGEFYGVEQNNPNYEQYREENPNWNQLPYDLEYSCGAYTSQILEDLRDLYQNCEMYFDIYGNFCFNMVPSCQNDPVTLDNDFIQEILIAENSESVSYDIKSISNVTEVMGKVYDIDRMCDSVSMSGNVYTLQLENYSSYNSGEIIAFTAPANNLVSAKIRIGSLPSIPLYNEYSTTSILPNTIVKNETHCIKISYSKGVYVAYYLGQFQPHAICVLTNDLNDPEYTTEYFQKKYNCKNIIMRVANECPFTVQKQGVILETLSGDNFDNILSDSTAISNAIYYNKNHSTMYDTVSITTKMIPYLDINTKVSYRKQQSQSVQQYIVKSISNDLENNTSSITLFRFSPLYYDS